MSEGRSSTHTMGFQQLRRAIYGRGYRAIYNPPAQDWYCELQTSKQSLMCIYSHSPALTLLLEIANDCGLRGMFETTWTLHVFRIEVKVGYPEIAIKDCLHSHTFIIYHNVIIKEVRIILKLYFPLWKNCLPWNWSLVSKRLGTADLQWKYTGTEAFT